MDKHYQVTLTNLCDITITQNYIEDFCDMYGYPIEDVEKIYPSIEEAIIKDYLEFLIYNEQLSLGDYNDIEFEEV